MESSVVIRKATRQDLEAVLALWRQFMAHQEGPDPRFQRAPDGEERFLELAVALLEQEEARFLVATKSSRVVGYIMGRLANNPPTMSPARYGYVAELFVEPGERGQGVGQRLYQALHQWFREQGVSSVQLRALTTNREGQAFWRAQGFTDFMDILWQEIR